MAASGKVAVVTGAASGIGRATATLMAADGTALFLVDRDAAGVARAAAELAGGEAKVLHAALDVTDGAAVAAAMARAEAELGGIDVLVNAAGMLGFVGAAIDCQEDEWDRLFAVNVKSIYLCARAAVPAMRRRGGGSIVNLASTAGLVGSTLVSAYSATKGAVVLLTRSMALNHAPEKIRVNCVCPGSIDTPMLQENMARAAVTLTPEQVRAAFLSRHPLGRFGEADEVAQMVHFLASDAASFMTGTAIPVDGGRIA
ncbi:MAG: SDR family NAD(P)-dependent oxidoreductase [Alphaproteobacteria bacterium]